MSDQKLETSEEINPLLAGPTQIDPELLQRNLKLPLEMCEQGRVLLKQKKYLEASKSFSKSIMAFEYLLKNQLLSKEQTKQLFQQVIIPTYSNLSLCHLKIGAYDSVVAVCNQILNHDSAHIKAKYRRGLARLEMQQYDEAIQDFVSVGQLDPEMKVEAEAQIRNCKAREMKQKQKQKKIAANFLGGLSDNRSSKVVIEPTETKHAKQAPTQKWFQKYKDIITSCCLKLFNRK